MPPRHFAKFTGAPWRQGGFSAAWRTLGIKLKRQAQSAKG